MPAGWRLPAKWPLPRPEPRSAGPPRQSLVLHPERVARGAPTATMRLHPAVRPSKAVIMSGTGKSVLRSWLAACRPAWRLLIPTRREGDYRPSGMAADMWGETLPPDPPAHDAAAIGGPSPARLRAWQRWAAWAVLLRATPAFRPPRCRPRHTVPRTCAARSCHSRARRGTAQVRGSR